VSLGTTSFGSIGGFVAGATRSALRKALIKERRKMVLAQVEPGDRRLGRVV